MENTNKNQKDGTVKPSSGAIVRQQYTDEEILAAYRYIIQRKIINDPKTMEMIQCWTPWIYNIIQADIDNIKAAGFIVLTCKTATQDDDQQKKL